MRKTIFKKLINKFGNCDGEEAYKVSSLFLISYQESIIKFYYFIFRFIYIRIDLNLLTLHFINMMLITFIKAYKSDKTYVYKLFITEY